MILMIVVGLIGAVLHVNTNLVGQGEIVVERFVRGSPLLGPLLYANVGMLGLVALLDPAERSP
jgi:ethanolamine transporter EutH